VRRVSIAAPTLGGNERKYVLECLDTTWISSHGRFIEAFERSFADLCGVRFAIATNNGTTALHLALVALGIRPGDEVIVPTVTYIATANAVTYCGATPVLVDVLPGTLNLDPSAVERAITERTKAIIPVHLYGQPADLGAIGAIAERAGLHVVEDAAEAHGARIGDSVVGSFGTAAMFSFFGNKIVTTGEGGMVLTDDEALADRLRLYRGQGMDPHRRYWFPVIGYNYRMTNIQAAIGLAQVERIDKALARRAEAATWYDELLEAAGQPVLRPAVDPGTTRVDWMYNVFLEEGGDRERAAVMARLDEHGIETRPVFIPLHQLPPYRADGFPVADDWAARGISLPMHEGLEREDVEAVVASLVVALGSR
jgi:perosamine synthetase